MNTDTTRRERAMARLERRRTWAAGRMAKAEAGMKYGESYRHDWAFITQPGHIPARERIIKAQDRSAEHAKIADYHESKAQGIEQQLARTIFSDDENAVEALRAKIQIGRRKIEIKKAANKIIRKYKSDQASGVAELGKLGISEQFATKLFEPDFAGRLGFPTFELTNLGANIRRMEGRIIQIERMNAHKAKENELTINEEIKEIK